MHGSVIPLLLPTGFLCRLVGMHGSVIPLLLPTLPFLTPLQAKHIWAPITPDEYDAAVRTSPALCPLAATGDCRSGRQLLADATEDARRTVAGLAACRAGRAELDAIAAAAEAMARA